MANTNEVSPQRGRRPKLTADQATLAQQLYDAREETVPRQSKNTTATRP